MISVTKVGQWVALGGLSVALAACQRATLPAKNAAKPRSPNAPLSGKAAPTAQSDPSRARPKAAEQWSHEEAVRRIVDLAKKNQWEEAEAQASALYALDPKNPSVQRVYSWIKTEGPKRREKQLEDEIRDVASKDSRLNPTLKSIATDKKSKGLPPRSELREALEQIKATPYIPSNFGKTIEAKGAFEDIESSKGRMAAILDKEISVKLDNVTLESIIFNMGQAEGINFIADKSLPAFQQKLSVNMKNVKLSEFLRYVSRNLDVQFQVGDNLIWIVDGKDPKKLMEETRFYRLRRGFIIPAQYGISESVKTTVTANNVQTATETQKFENFVNDAAPKSPSIETAIKQFFEGSKWYIDLERNLIVARGTFEQLRVLERIISEFDRPIQQVLIEARFITVTETAFLQLGMNWASTSGTGQAGSDYSGIPSVLGGGFQWNWSGVLGQDGLNATLTALEQSGESETLSAPRLTLVNNLPAKISDGTVQYYYEEYTVTQTILERSSKSSLAPLGKPTKLNSGVNLDVLASIGGDGKTILLALKPEVIGNIVMKPFLTLKDRDETGNLASSLEINLPQYRSQSLATRVMVKSGQTVVLGGVVQEDQRTYVESVPVISNIPLIGALFRRRSEVNTPRYLLVFVTATLLSESGEFVVIPEAE